MGVIETVIKYNREEGKEIGVLLYKLEQDILFLEKFRTRNFTNEDLADIANMTISFVENFKTAYTLQKLQQFWLDFEVAKDISELVELKKFLVESMYQYGFTPSTLKTYLKIEKRQLDKIIKAYDDKQTK